MASSITAQQTPIESPAETSSLVTHEARGTHLLLTLFGCPTNLLNDETAMRELTQQAAEATGATVLQISSHQFTPHGVTALAVLAESHASIHTYPESGVVFWDCFTCGQTCKPELSISPLVDTLNPSSIQKQIILRGTTQV
jgi:S-adenosylmethionine decarboxylase